MKGQIIRYRPKGETAWCYDKISQAEAILENGESWEMELTVKTEDELANMPEFQGW